MLDGAKFAITIRENNFSQIREIVLLYQQLHAKDSHFFLHKTKSDRICLKSCHPKAECEHYPLDVILPMVQYKACQLEGVPDPYTGGDGTSIRAFEIFEDHHGLNIKRTYLYAGK